jgi:hypothetical protein
MKDYIDKLKSGDENLLVPPSSFEWSSYKFIFTATLRKHCGDNNWGFDEVIYNEIMKLFGDEMLEIYNNNK